MILGKLTKAAVVVGLLFGQITPPSQHYYEDDADYNTVPTTYSTGWGWGFNKAYAGCDSIPADATNVPDECIDIHADPLDDSSYDIYPDSENSDSGSSGYVDPGQGGDENSGQPVMTEQQAKVIAECIVESAALYEPCVEDVTQLINDLKFVCDLTSMLIGGFNVYVGAGVYFACYAAYRHDMGQVDDICTANVEEAEESCH